jgi:hypothetical protein
LGSPLSHEVFQTVTTLPEGVAHDDSAIRRYQHVEDDQTRRRLG